MFSFKRNFKVKCSDTGRSSLPQFKFVLTVTFVAKQMQMATLINRIQRWERLLELRHRSSLTACAASVQQRYCGRENTIRVITLFCLLKTVE